MNETERFNEWITSATFKSLDRDFAHMATWVEARKSLLDERDQFFRNMLVMLSGLGIITPEGGYGSHGDGYGHILSDVSRAIEKKKIEPRPPNDEHFPHRRVFEYDGAFRCHDCRAQWGALPGNPTKPERCELIDVAAYDVERVISRCRKTLNGEITINELRRVWKVLFE